MSVGRVRCHGMAPWNPSGWTTSERTVTTETLELRALYSVVKHASYAKAARELGLSPSGVSRIITRLERRLGVRLVQRTTRKLSLTEAGVSFHAKAAQILTDLAEAEATVQASSTAARGSLRISAPVAFGLKHLVPLTDALLRLHPELSVEIVLVDRFVDLIHEEVDLAIRIGTLDASGLIARRLCQIRRVLVAARSYLETYGEPATLEELSEHECLLYSGFRRTDGWTLKGPDGLVSVPVSGRITSNTVQVLLEAARLGRGIAVGPTVLVSELLESGELIRLLAPYEFEPRSIYAVYPSARQLSTKVRVTVDFLASRLCDPPPWDACLGPAEE